MQDFHVLIALAAIAGIGIGILLGSWIESRDWRLAALIKPPLPLLSRGRNYYVVTEEQWIAMVRRMNR